MRPHVAILMLVVAVSPVLVATASPAQRAPAGPPLTDAEAVRAIGAHYDAAARAGTFSGAVMLTRGDQVLLSRAWGLADRRWNVANTPEMKFNLGSIGKIFTRIGIAQLAAKGTVSLDDPVSKFLPGFPHADSITVAMLCAHRSGIGDFFNDAYDAMNHGTLRHNRDYVPLFRDQPLLFAPGTDRRYSNGSYALLGEIIAKASGEDYYDYLARHIFEPAGATSTAALFADAPDPGVAMGYTTSEDSAGPARENIFSRPARGSAAGGSYSTTGDVKRIDDALVGHRLVDPAWSAWVMGGPRPGPQVAGPPGPPGFGVAGGAPGIAALWRHEGQLVLIVFANLDPPTVEPVNRGAEDLFMRMRRGPATP